MPFQVYLYSTTGCHLCDEAKEICVQAIRTLQLQGQFELREIDIAEDARLFQNYGAAIPVLQVKAAASALYWPFSVESVCEYLSAHKAY